MGIFGKIVLYLFALALCFGLNGVLFLFTYQESDTAGTRFYAVSWIPWLLAIGATFLCVRSVRHDDRHGV